MLLGSSLIWIACVFQIRAEDTSLQLMCIKPESLGLFEQCETVKVLQEVGDKFRYYSFSKKRVGLSPKQNFFRAHRPGPQDNLRAKQIVALPGHFLWNASSDGHFSLCSLFSSSRGNFGRITCGYIKDAEIQKSSVLVLRPWI